MDDLNVFSFIRGFVEVKLAEKMTDQTTIAVQTLQLLIPGSPDPPTIWTKAGTGTLC